MLDSQEEVVITAGGFLNLTHNLMHIQQHEKGGFAMQITDVRVRKVTKEGKLKAVVSITLDEEFVVHDIKVIEGDRGLFIAMPSKRGTDDEYRDIAHPINSTTRQRLQETILARYDELKLEVETVGAAV